ncbi:MAG: galactokinase [bacterium]
MAIPQQLLTEFNNQFGDIGSHVLIRSPGRVNLIGEHTDYNAGFVLPIAIEPTIYILAQPRKDKNVALYSMNYQERAAFALNTISRSPGNTWLNYPKGVVSRLVNSGLIEYGFNAVIYGDIPVGAGLSSSAALEMAIAYTAQQLYGFELSDLEMIKLCQQAENEFVGVQCGIMDQFIIRLGKENAALLIDCRSLTYEHVPMPGDNYSMVICDSGVKRGLLDSEYNSRRQQCLDGTKLLQQYLPKIQSLRDVSWSAFQQYQEKLPELIAKRCRHVISENQRVLDAVAALKEKKLQQFGLLMNQSHESLKHDFEVSCRELDILVELAQNTVGCLGSRMTGAGFGGCTVSLVDTSTLENFVSYLDIAYIKIIGLKPEFYITHAKNGIERISLSEISNT